MQGFLAFSFPGPSIFVYLEEWRANMIAFKSLKVQVPHNWVPRIWVIGVVYECSLGKYVIFECLNC